MKKPSRFLRVLGAAGLLIGLLAATIAPVAAQEDDTPSQDGLDALIGLDGVGFLDGNNSIFYPWVANNDNFGLGPADTSISIQNLEDEDAAISILVGDKDGGFDEVETAYLSAYAAKTFTAEALGIAEGDGAPVWVIAFGESPDPADPIFPDADLEDILVETPIILSKPEGVEGDFTQVIACVVNAYADEDDLSGSPVGFVVAADFEFDVDGDGVIEADEQFEAGDVYADAFTQADLQDILEDAQAGSVAGELVNPFGGLNDDGDCFDAFNGVIVLNSVAIGGVAKQTAEAGATNEDEGSETEQLSTTDTAVSGYNAVNGAEVADFNEWYLPIVQTNCGPGGCWSSMLRVGNADYVNNAVTIRFFPASDGSGSLQTGFQIQANIDGGDTWNVNLGDLVPEGWVGSAHIFSDGQVFAMVDRYKVGYNMWLTNTGSSADFERGEDEMPGAQVPGSNGRFALFAPHVLIDYFGWNTGINVANLVDEDNNVSVQYFNMIGNNATEVLNQRLAPHGMNYFYDPSQAPQDNNQQDVTTDVNANVVGSAIIWSDFPVAAAIDATKYPESDPNGGADVLQGTSYSATANVFTWQAVPLVQKGNPIDGSGATSGINIMNPNAEAVTADVYWVNPSGFLADNFGVSGVTIPGFANGFVYTLTQHNLPNGFTGAAQVVASAPVAAVSANVNYDVEGDGAAIFNAFNPCGFFRVSAECSFGPVFEPGGQSITKYFVVDDLDGEDETTVAADAIGIAGVQFQIVNAEGTAAFQRQATSGTDGSATLSNVPVGVYNLFVLDTPGDIVDVDPTVAVDTIVVTEGEDVVLVNELGYDQGFTKTVCVQGEPSDEVIEQINDILDDDSLSEAEQQAAINALLNSVPCLDGSELGGINITVYENIGEDFLGAPVAGDVVFEGVTDADGMVGAGLAPGNYILCMWDDDEEATTEGGETVNPVLPNEVTPTILCASSLFGFDFEVFGDLFTVEPGVTTNLINSVAFETGTINIFLWEQGATTGMSLQQEAGQVPVEAGVEVCIDSYDSDYYDCAVTEDDSGWVKFEDAPSYLFDLDGDTQPTSYQLDGSPGYNYFLDDWTFFDATVYSDDYVCVDAEGGELTAEIEIESDCSEFGSAQLDGQDIHQEIAGTFSFWYSPSADLGQDGYNDDVDANGDLRGSFDIEVEMTPVIEE